MAKAKKTQKRVKIGPIKVKPVKGNVIDSTGETITVAIIPEHRVIVNSIYTLPQSSICPRCRKDANSVIRTAPDNSAQSRKCHNCGNVFSIKGTVK